VSLKDIGNDQAALRKMFVKKEFRGSRQAVAKTLLKTALDWAADNGLKEIYLGTTPKFLAAHRFYEKSGFVEIFKSDLPESFPLMAVDTKFYVFKMHQTHSISHPCGR